MYWQIFMARLIDLGIHIRTCTIVFYRIGCRSYAERSIITIIVKAESQRDLKQENLATDNNQIGLQAQLKHILLNFITIHNKNGNLPNS